MTGKALAMRTIISRCGSLVLTPGGRIFDTRRGGWVQILAFLDHRDVRIVPIFGVGIARKVGYTFTGESCPIYTNRIGPTEFWPKGMDCTCIPGRGHCNRSMT